MRPLRGFASVQAKGKVVTWDTAMKAALFEAASAPSHGDIPIGAVLLDGQRNVVASNHNRREELGDATAHAEMLVISQRSSDLGSWHLEGHTLVVTVEPCAMCAMAAVWARIDRIVYGAADLKAGACWSQFNIPQDERLNHRIELIAGVRADEAAAQLEGFFTERR
jgi:tRNA(adenine34) deaminase